MKVDLWFPCFVVSMLLASCGDDSFTPTELAGVYRLTAVNGTPPPVIELATIECDQLIVDGFLVLSAEGGHDLRLSIELECPRGGDGSVQERTYAGTFTVNDDDLEFVAPGSAVGDVVFRGRAGETSVAVDLPATVVEIGPLLHLRFEKDVCPEICLT
jgi:hypothetical protein